MIDIFGYDRAFAELLKRLGKEHSCYSEALTLQSRLLENSAQSRRYGDTETRRAERAQILAALNTLSLHHLGCSFNDLCRPTEPPSTKRATPAERPWRGGAEVYVRGEAYLLHDPIEETHAADRSFVQRRAKAWQPESDRLAWLEQVRVIRRTAAAVQARDSLSHEGRLLAKFELQPDFPRLLNLDVADDSVTLAFSLAHGPTLAQAFGPVGQPLDLDRTYRLLRSLRPLCRMLSLLHRENLAHRHLSPETIVLLEGRREHAILRDLGLAAQPRAPDEGPPLYRAPEQARRASLALPGPHTDIYQLGALLYHLLTGRAAASFPGRIEPLTTWNPSFPPELDEALLGALVQDPSQRWRTIGDLWAALDRAAGRLRDQLRGEL